MSIKVNLQDTEEFVGYEILPNGWYLARINDAEVRIAGDKAKNPGSEYISWEFYILDEEYKGRRVWHITTLIPDKLGGLKGLLKSTGEYSDSELNSDELEFDLDDLSAGDVTVAIKVGRRKNKNTDEFDNVVKATKLASELQAGDSSMLPD